MSYTAYEQPVNSFVEHSSPYCTEVAPHPPYYNCTRTEGHLGPHEAGIDGPGILPQLIVASWS